MHIFAGIAVVAFLSAIALICCTAPTNVREARCTIYILPEDHKDDHENGPKIGTVVFGRSPSATVEPWIAK